MTEGNLREHAKIQFLVRKGNTIAVRFRNPVVIAKIKEAFSRCSNGASGAVALSF